MEPGNWTKIKDLFLSALELPAAERAAFLDRECGADENLRAEVAKLLESHQEDDRFLEDSAVAQVASAINSDDFPIPAAPGLPKFSAGDRLKDRYEIVRLLGKGGMGEVYLANDLRIARKVALKVLHADVASNKERVHRFAIEARAVSALNHPHVMTIFEYDSTDDGTLFIVGEFVDGKTLNQYCSTEKISIGRILDIAIQVASALSAAHDAGITHRDIKPDNIMVRRDGYIKLLDLGLAKLSDQGGPQDFDSKDPTKALLSTNPGAIMGTAAYMSPEQTRGIRVDGRADIWSRGVVRYEMLTGVRPFGGETVADIMVSVLNSEPRPIGQTVPNLAPELIAAVSKALRKDARERFQTADEFRTELEKIKKKIEYGEVLQRARTAAAANTDGNDGIDDSTDLMRQVPTAGGGAKETGHGRRPETNPDSPARSESVRNAAISLPKAGFARAVLYVVLLVALISSVVYFGFMRSSSTSPIDSIAVLPFENLSGDESFNYFSDGISESLIDRLSQLPQLRVIARSSSFSFRGSSESPASIAAKLGVRAIVTGSVTRSGDDLSIRVDIVDALENRHLYGDAFKRRVGDSLSIQSEIARAVTDQLRLKLDKSQSKRLARNPTDNEAAFNYYLNGLVELNGPKDVRGDAFGHFTRAIELDPDFAAAHTEIAWIEWSRANAEGDPAEQMPRVKAATAKALTLDPNNAKAHVMQATVHEFEFDWPAAENAYRRAIELNPNLDFARNNYASFLSNMGRFDEALGELEQMRVRDPINERLNLLFKAGVLAQARRFDEALATYQKAQAIDQSVPVPNYALGYVYGGKGMSKEAARYFKKSVDVSVGEDKYSLALVYLAAAYAKDPETVGEARRILKRIEGMEEYRSPTVMAVIHAALGDNDRAMAELEQAYLKRDIQLRYIASGYEYDGLRSDPRFSDLLRRTGFTKR